MSINDGIFIKMKDYIILKIDVNCEEDIKEMNLYYKDKTIISLENSNSIYIVDYIDNQEYFDFRNINDILKNMYLKVKFESDNTITTKLDYTQVYSNKNIFLTYKNQNQIDVAKEINTTSKLSKKFDNVYDKYGEYNVIIEISNIKYNVVIFDSNLSIDYTRNKTNYVLNYNKFDYEYFSKSKDGIDIYSSVIENNKCHNKSKECNMI